MALALELTRIPGSEYLPRPEFMSGRASRGFHNEGIWDVLGEYESDMGTIILCEHNMIDLAEELSSGMSSVYPVLRELVRLHEHAHAYVHTASLFEGIYERPLTQRDWFKRLPTEVNESLTEYIALSILESCSGPPAWLKLFHEIDSRAPAYYKKWKQARRLRREKVFIAPTLKFARTRIWNDWNEFYETLAEEQDKVNEEAALLRLRG